MIVTNGFVSKLVLIFANINEISIWESQTLVFSISNILNTGLDHHTFYVLVAPCDRRLKSETLVVKEFGKDRPLTFSMTSTPLDPWLCNFMLILICFRISIWVFCFHLCCHHVKTFKWLLPYMNFCSFYVICTYFKSW